MISMFSQSAFRLPNLTILTMVLTKANKYVRADSAIEKLKICVPKLFYKTRWQLWKTKENILVVPVGSNLNTY